MRRALPHPGMTFVPKDEIARILNIPVQQIYRLRDRVQRHALRVFSRQGITEVWLGNR